MNKSLKLLKIWLNLVWENDLRARGRVSKSNLGSKIDISFRTKKIQHSGQSLNLERAQRHDLLHIW